MNPRTVEKLGTELTEALTHLTQARNLILGSYNHADEYATEADLKLLKHGEAIIGQLDRLLERLTKYKTEIIQSQDIKEGMTMRVSKEFKRAARKEILRQKRLRESGRVMEQDRPIMPHTRVALDNAIRAIDTAYNELKTAYGGLQRVRQLPREQNMIRDYMSQLAKMGGKLGTTRRGMG